jgi:hypothetical protein
MANDSENYGGFSNKEGANAFEKLSKLFQDDPEEFEKYRQMVIEEFINNLPEERQQRARGLQFRIDNEMRKIKNPLARAAKMNSMMVDSLMELQGVFKVALGGTELPEPTEKADVLPFARKTTEDK